MAEEKKILSKTKDKANYKRYVITLPAKDHEAIRKISHEKYISMQEAFGKAVKDYIKKYAK